MKKLTSLILSAAIAPTLALSTAAFAQDAAGMERAGDKQGAGEQYSGDQRAEQQYSGDQRAEQQRSGEHPADQQYISRKPAGALYADDVIGKTVKHRASGDDVGKIQNLIIGEDGRIVGVVIKSGGFLGLGGQEVGLGWNHLEHTIGDDKSVFYTDMDEDSLKNAPEYERK
ncbi:MAG: PRC-barrel domain-containing protein [Ectothiorhodospiraceae bacterium]|nr:PRC-barrel domain-containing protein [Ectothiorhodospiraceae bacterium]